MARWLHAIVAALVIVLVGLGVAMTRGDLALERMFAAYQWHKTLGVCVWLLMLVRVAVRVRSGEPVVPVGHRQRPSRTASDFPPPCPSPTRGEGTFDDGRAPGTENAALRARLAHGVHLLFYGVLLVMPVTGWLMVSAAPLSFPVSVFGLLDLPSLSWLAGAREETRQVWFVWLKTAHTALACVVVVLVVGHIVAAVSHGRAALARMSIVRSKRHV